MFSAFCLAASLVTADTARAQSGRATVSGIVTDETGAVVGGVDVTATNQDTNVVTSAATNSSGPFKKDGFKAQSREGFTVGVAQA